MIDEIESILRADDVAREEVEAAGVEAGRVKTRAHRQAEEIVSEKKRELAAFIGAEEESILKEAHFRSEKILNEASHYIQGLQDRKNAVLNDLVEILLGKVTGA